MRMPQPLPDDPPSRALASQLSRTSEPTRQRRGSRIIQRRGIHTDALGDSPADQQPSPHDQLGARRTPGSACIARKHPYHPQAAPNGGYLRAQLLFQLLDLPMPARQSGLHDYSYVRPWGCALMSLRARCETTRCLCGTMMPVKLMVFLHGTSIMHAIAAGRPRAERVLQSSQREPSVFDFASYVPTEAAVQKVRAWQREGAEICYLSSHRTPENVQLDRDVLAAHGFPAGPVFFREPGEGYAEVARRAGAEVIVEDNCESIGSKGDDRLRPGPDRKRCCPLRHRPRVRRPCRSARQHPATGRAMSGAPPATLARAAEQPIAGDPMSPGRRNPHLPWPARRPGQDGLGSAPGAARFPRLCWCAASGHMVSDELGC